uniref:Reverse transcriptase domain-containing protein n=1 Tax=Tanacetum cinerariifolium TaxID=118510 RepID=A0A6L2JEH3_TANCI|nr:reverse transcriptase domain-containing protein [Tanacetum cinerariifolium]
MQTQTSNTLHNAIMEAGSNDRPPMLAPDKKVPISEGIDNDIYSTVDACPNACEMWKAIERENQDNSPRINRGAGFENQRIGNVDGAWETVGTTVVQKSRIQCYNCREFRHVARECQKLKRVKDAAYHREKMLLCKQEEAGIQLNAEQADWRDDTDDELEDQELEARYMYMEQIQEVSPDAADSGPIFDVEPLQKVSNDDHYNVFAIESEHPEQSKSIHETYPIEQDEHNVIIDSLDMSYNREQIDQNDDDNDLANERELLASSIEKLKCEIDDNKNHNKFLETSNKSQAELQRRNDMEYASKVEIDCAKADEDLISYKMKSQNSFNKYTQMINDLNQMIFEMKKLSAHQETISILSQQKEAQIKLYKTCKDKELDKVTDLETKSREYYYADHMNAILGVYTELDEVTNLQCDYLELLEKCECLEKELSKSKMMSKGFEALQKHSINLEIDLQQCQEKIKNDKSFKENQSKEFRKEREQYFKIQDLKAQLYDKGIVIRVIPTTSVSRPQLKSNPMKDRVMLNNSKGKKQEVEDQCRNVKLSKNKTSVTACNDSLNAKTLNVNFVCATCVKLELRTIVAQMTDNRTMEELLQAPTEGYGETIVIPKINADHFEIKTNLLQLVQANPYRGFERENPHTHINNFKMITLTLKFRDVHNDDLVNKFVNQFFPPSKTTHLKNEISRFTQRFEETFGEAWERFKEMLRACPHHEFKELAQIDTFYNGLNDNDQDSLNAATGGNLLSKTTGEALKIIENKSKVCYSRNKSNVSRMNTTSRENVSKSDDRIDKLADQISTLVDIFAKKVITPAPVKVVEESCVTCGAMPLKKLPKKLGDPGKFLIPCDFSGMDVCHALADLSASINLMPLSIWKKLSLPELTPTRMTLELEDRSVTRTKGVAEDVFVKMEKFHFSTDFIVVNFEANPRVPLVLGRSFLRTDRTLIDVYGEEITLRVNDEAVTFNLNQTMRYSSTYDDLSVNQIDIIDVAREEYAQEIIGFSLGGNSTSTSEPILSDSLPSFTPFEGSDFILEEIEAYLKDESISPEINHADCDPEGDICLIEKLLNDDPFQLPPMDLKQGEVVKAKSLIKKPLESELKDLPSHLEYAYLEGVDKLPVIIAKDLKVDEREVLLKVLKSHKRAIAWKITDIKGIDPRFCTHKILMEEDYKPAMGKLIQKLLLNQKCMGYLVRAYYSISPTSIVYTDHSALKYLLSKQDAKPRLIWWVLFLQEFNIIIRDKKGTENLAANHLSRLENPHKDVFENKDINENFLLETLGKISSESTPWFADFANFQARNFIIKGMLSQQKKKFFKDVKHYFRDDPYLFRICTDIAKITRKEPKTRQKQTRERKEYTRTGNYQALKATSDTWDDTLAISALGLADGTYSTMDDQDQGIRWKSRIEG